MRVQNLTPFPHVLFERRGLHDERLAVLVLQATYDVRTGQPLALADEQRAVQLIDAYRGDPKTTSLRMPGAVATYKPCTDVTFDAVAHAPDKRATPEWPVSMRVGPVTKHLLIRGPSEWVHGPIFGWRRRAAEPVKRVPITYERAFGGRWIIDGEVVDEPRNPVGTGFLPNGAPTHSPVAAPQVLHFGEAEHRPGDRYAPAGLGAIPPHFDPRPGYLGTTDSRWLSERHPLPPLDFDDAFYQAAHPELVAPGHLRGDESIAVVNARSDGKTLRTELPRVSTIVELDLGRRSLATPAVIDAVHFDLSHDDPDRHQAVLTFRLVFPVALEPSTVRVLAGSFATEPSYAEA